MVNHMQTYTHRLESPRSRPPICVLYVGRALCMDVICSDTLPQDWSGKTIYSCYYSVLWRSWISELEASGFFFLLFLLLCRFYSFPTNAFNHHIWIAQTKSCAYNRTKMVATTRFCKYGA